MTADNRLLPVPRFTAAGRSGRVSIYTGRNGAAFLAAPVVLDSDFIGSVGRLRSRLQLDELHLTGGEPTLHPEVAALVDATVRLGFQVAITSNGERPAIIHACGAVGLNRVNFSIFGTTPDELFEVQGPAARGGRPRAQRKMDALRGSITACSMTGVRASANIVVPDIGHADRVHRLLDEYSRDLSVRLLNSLDHGPTSVSAIKAILRSRGALPIAHHVVAGVSGFKTEYRLPDGRRLMFKRIRRVRLPVTCSTCDLNNDRDCHEGFYGVRLYRDQDGRHMVGVCIQRMDLCQPVDEFLDGPLPDEIMRLRTAEYDRLTGAGPRLAIDDFDNEE